MPNKDLRKEAVPFRLILTEETLSHLPVPPLAGPMRSMMPEALRLARCFSMALAEMPIFAARAAALNVPSSASKATIFSQLFAPFSLLFKIFSLLKRNLVG